MTEETKIPKILVEYDGKYPNLCSGTLKITIDDVEYVFPSQSLSSGGSIKSNYDGTYKGPWTISEWPECFPEILKLHVEKAVNKNVEHGCCGGCI